ncbi:MAG: hypothetical protein AAFY71_11695 [Bacteroidota bacterium]
MEPIYFIPFAIIFIGGAFLIGFIRNRNFDRKEKLHKNLAVRLGLSLSYQSEEDFLIFGTYKDYKVRLETIEIRTRDNQDGIPALKWNIPMINPQLKILRIAKDNPSYPQLTSLAYLDRPVNMAHDLGEWLSITTNDLMFGSILLSDDLKISLFEVFNPIEGGLLYIDGEELAIVRPHLILKEEDMKWYQKGLDLICDIKDELNS